MQKQKRFDFCILTPNFCIFTSDFPASHAAVRIFLLD